MKLQHLFPTLALVAGIGLSAGPTQASHLFVTDPFINGIALDSLTGFTNPVINATVGSSLDVLAGFYGITSPINWTMQFTGGPLALSSVALDVTASSDPGTPLYVLFSQILTTAGTFTGVLEPVQGESCPSYRYGTGDEGGGGCGSPSESIPFTLNVSNVPEPASLALLGAGLAGLGFARRRRAG